jgi:hypothetical protein
VEWTQRGFEGLGFKGWTTFGELTRDELPDEHGVYVVLVEPSNVLPAFLVDSVGRPHKKKALTVEVEKLERAWQSGSEVLYLGKAGGARGLHDRLWAYAQQGRGFSAGHQGGRYLWQLPGSELLTVGWRATGKLDSHDVEDALLSLYIAPSQI